MEERDSIDKLYSEKIKLKKSLPKRFGRLVKNLTRWDIALPCAGSFALWAGITNYEHGIEPAVIAGAKQLGLSTIASAGLFKYVDYISKRIKDSKAAYAAITAFPVVSVGVTFYLIHKYTGTPEPFDTVIMPAVIGGTFSYITAYTSRKNMDRANLLSL